MPTRIKKLWWVSFTLGVISLIVVAVWVTIELFFQNKPFSSIPFVMWIAIIGLAIGGVISVIGNASQFIALVQSWNGKEKKKSIPGETTSRNIFIPHQKPRRAEHFIGREKELAKLLEDLQPGKAVTLCGPGGIGKTALATEAIWSLAPDDEPPERFPDGIIFYSFYGKPDIALAFEHISRSYDENAREFSTDAVSLLLSRKKALIVLDGAEEASDLQNVLQVCGGCVGILISTRKKDKTHAPGKRIDIKSLKQNDGIKLLKKRGKKWAADDAADKEIWELVGGLPLALQLAGAYLSSSEQTSAEYLESLRASPLEALEQGKRSSESVRVLIKKSIGQISEESRTALATIGLLALSPFSVETISSGLEIQMPEARKRLGELVSYGLLQRVKDRYQVSHPLIHTFARLEMDMKDDVLERLAGYYTTFSKDESEKGLEGHHRLDGERIHVLKVLENSAQSNLWDAVSDLSWAIDKYLDLQGYWTELIKVRIWALEASQQSGYRRGEGNHLGNLGLAYSALGQVEKAISFYEQALAISREIGDRHGEGAELGNLGLAYSALGQVEKAISFYEQALAISREVGDRRGEGNHLGNLGNAYRALGQVEKAIEYYEQALTISREIGDRRSEGTDLGNLGDAYSALGQVEKAIMYNEKALLIDKEIKNRRGEGCCLDNLGTAYRKKGDLARALSYYQQAIFIMQEIKNRRLEGIIFDNIGLTYKCLNEVENAINNHERALSIFQDVSDRRYEGIVLVNLGANYRELGQIDRAIKYYEKALHIFEELKLPDAEEEKAILLALRTQLLKEGGE